MKKVDGFCRNAENAFGKDLVCQKGCHSCCRHLTLFPVEAFHIRLAMNGLESELQRKIRKNALALVDDPDGACPLLNEGLCLLYRERPLICRTHGLPVLMRTEKGSSVDHCPLNFTSGKKPEIGHILDIEQLNTTLIMINRLFLKNQVRGDDEILPERILLADALLIDPHNSNHCAESVPQ